MYVRDVTIVGVDLSLTSTGISYGDTQRAIQTKTTGMARLDAIRTEVVGLLDLPNPVFIIEGYSFASRNSQSHAAGELGGLIRWTLWQAGVGYVDIPPTVRAKFATGKGNAGKSEVVSSVSARTGIVWEGKGADDMCDAWVLEEMGRTYIGSCRYDWPAVHRSALDKIDWSALEIARGN